MLPALRPLSVAGGRIRWQAGSPDARLAVGPTPAGQYTNAQLDDYAPPTGTRWRALFGGPRFSNRPPLRLRLRARASHAAPIGTLGFGFWNNPFTPAGLALSTPNVAWFFYASPPSDMALARGVPGWGWKAATLNTGRLPGWLVAPAAVPAILLTLVPGLGRPIMAAGRALARAHEALLGDVLLTEWHEYTLDWLPREAVFRVDGFERLRSPVPPHGPLGFVLWIDNQYMIVSRGGRFGFGIRPLDKAQWLEVEGLEVT